MGRDARMHLVNRTSQGVLDRLGRPLEAGDLVTYTPRSEPLYKVLSITPQLDPKGPGGFTVVVMTQWKLTLPAGQPVFDLILCRGADPVVESVKEGDDGSN